MPTTTELRRVWAPACKGPFVRIPLNGTGVISVKASTVEAWEALNRVLIKYGYLTRKEDTGAYNCRPITGGTDYSLHAYAIAADLNWKTNLYGEVLVTDMPIEMIREIEAIRTNSGDVVFRWGGRYSGNKDAMHFEIVCTPNQLATGIANSKLVPTPIGSEDEEEIFEMLAKSKEDAAELFVRKTFDELRLRAPTGEELKWFIGRTLNEGVSPVWTTIRDEPESQEILTKRRQDVGLPG